MSQRIILCFDGTSNKPEDSVDDRGLLSIKDASITNVLKLHLLLGGDLTDGQHIDGQKSFYFSGVGTRGSVSNSFSIQPLLSNAGRFVKSLTRV